MGDKTSSRKQFKLVINRNDISGSGRDVIHKSRGLNSGLGICAFASELLKINEVLIPGKKMTDDDMRIIIIKEFPHRLSKPRSSVKRLYRREIGVWYYRALYNAGLLDGPKNQKPEKRSFRYDENGRAIKKTRGVRPKGRKTVGDILDERQWKLQSSQDQKPESSP